MEYRSEWSEEWSQLDTTHIPLNQSELRLPITGINQISIKAPNPRCRFFFKIDQVLGGR